MKKYILWVLLLNSLLLSACKKNNTATAIEEVAVEEVAVTEIELPEETPSSSKMYDAQEAPTEEPVATSVENENMFAKKIIKTANIKYQVVNLQAEKTKLLTQTNTLKGFVVSEIADATYNHPQIEFQLNIPSDNFDSFINSLEKDVTYFDLKEIKREDVTRDYVDVATRLKNQRALENRYLELLKQAKNVTEILEIEDKLNQIRVEIEISENRLKLYDRQVRYSTVTLTIFKELPYAKAPDRTFMFKTKNAIVGGFENFVESLIDILYLWPFFLIILILGLWFWIKYKKYKKKQTNYN
ncbi:DUF4349 domain-containing protein [Myroides sp. JBRI-B21084]|uniref:DUF4349 domain-containing protein n=1 Tax=Myroides sp. JBRI-B21084 TaxID=3119977 RepID=UPI0026E39DCD|nr:DUF4349 domain-containing protein [Paenimyroides cloacae]WKW45955.1 DUF4349 domain-containing protein [Paenimyroides cloacae]